MSRRGRFARARAVQILGEEFWKAAREKGRGVDDDDLAIRVEIACYMVQSKVHCSTSQDSACQTNIVSNISLTKHCYSQSRGKDFPKEIRNYCKKYAQS